MKKMKIMLIGFLLLISSTVSIHGEVSESLDLASSAKGVYLMEFNTGKEIYAKQENTKLYPASMTKMMGLLLIYEAIDAGKLSLQDTVTTSELAASMGGSQVFLEVNETMSVKDMMKAICIASANDAMVAMAEKVGGTHEHFVAMMNDKAKELKLSNTNFVNATGLHDAQHYSCAKDMAMIAQALIKIGGSDLLKVTATYDAYIREDSDKKFWLVNTNKLLKQYPGVDGLKTGFTQEALSCITVTAKKDNLRLISVIMGAPSSKERNAQSKQLLDYGFSQFSQGIVIPKDNIIKKDFQTNGLPEEVSLKVKEDVVYIFQKGKEPKEKNRQIEITKKSPPYKEHEVIGTITVEMDDGYRSVSPIYVTKAIKSLSYFDVFKQAMNQSIF